MPFLTEPEPERGVPLAVAPGVARIVARNPSFMTNHGTNTYLIQTAQGYVVLDPGPDDDAHIAEVLRATQEKVCALLVSHAHADHLGAAAALKSKTGAKIFGFRTSGDPSFIADVLLQDGDSVGELTAIHTPGHASDHLCFSRPDRVLFTADHVMSSSSSIVSPPDGDMSAYFSSLRLLLSRDDSLYLPGHGPPLPDPKPYVRDLLYHRIRREEAIFQSLRDGALTSWELVDRLYVKAYPQQRQAAERNVCAHLLKLRQERRVHQVGDRWRT